jgi:3-oxoacyl-[acyl-carrier protein] reductase
MDMCIKGRSAIVCAASRGFGKACALDLGQEGVDLVINARDVSALEVTAEEIRLAAGVHVTAAAADITTEAGRDAVLSACPDPDIMVNHAGDRRRETSAASIARRGSGRSTRTC